MELLSVLCMDDDASNRLEVLDFSLWALWCVDVIEELD